MNDAQFKLSQAKQYEPKYKNTLQDPKNEVYIEQNKAQAPVISER